MVGLAGLGVLTELALGLAGASWDCQAWLAGWVQGGLGRFDYPGTIRKLSGNYPGFGMAWLGWAGLAGWAGCERLGLLGWLGVLAGCWLDFDEKGTKY